MWYDTIKEEGKQKHNEIQLQEKGNLTIKVGGTSLGASAQDTRRCSRGALLKRLWILIYCILCWLRKALIKKQDGINQWQTFQLPADGGFGTAGAAPHRKHTGQGGIGNARGASWHLLGEHIERPRKASLTRGQQLLSKLVYACFEARAAVCGRRRSQLKSNELYDSAVTLLIHSVIWQRMWWQRGPTAPREAVNAKAMQVMAPALPLVMGACRPIRKLHVSNLAIITWRQ